MTARTPVSSRRTSLAFALRLFMVQLSTVGFISTAIPTNQIAFGLVRIESCIVTNVAVTVSAEELSKQPSTLSPVDQSRCVRATCRNL